MGAQSFSYIEGRERDATRFSPLKGGGHIKL